MKLGGVVHDSSAPLFTWALVPFLLSQVWTCEVPFWQMPTSCTSSFSSVRTWRTVFWIVPTRLFPLHVPRSHVVFQLTAVHDQVLVLLPADNIVDADDVLLVGIFRIAHDRGAGLDPGVTTVFIHHPVVVREYLAFVNQINMALPQPVSVLSVAEGIHIHAGDLISCVVQQLRHPRLAVGDGEVEVQPGDEHVGLEPDLVDRWWRECDGQRYHP